MMSKKGLIVTNLFLMLIVLFAVSFQSIHAFEHHINEDETHHHRENNLHSFTKQFSESDDCLVCEFKFATFLKSEIFSFKFYIPFKENPYSFSIKEAESFFCGSLFSLRGPPKLINY